MSHRLHFGKEVCESLHPMPTQIYDGTNIESFSKLVNECIVNCPTELVIICSEKARPKPEDVRKMIEFLNQGFGFVALWGLGFFGFTKELIRQIGFFDERYIGGGFEDVDFKRRLKLANIAIVWSFEIKFKNLASSWNNVTGSKMDLKKWKFGPDKLPIKLLDEPKYKYDLGPSKTDIKFMPYSESIHLPRRENSKLEFEYTHGTKYE